jgi:hypothetical protein
MNKERYYNSLGKQIAKDEQSLLNFYSWFGNSKVVDDSGKPLVVFHGTGEKFEEFDNVCGRRGIYFTDSFTVAKSYMGVQTTTYPTIMPVYLSIQKPLIVDFECKNYTDCPEIDSNKFMDLDDIVSYAKSAGYDGVIAKNIRDAACTDSSWESLTDVMTDYIAFEPNQVKSIYNSGRFNKASGNIYESADYNDEINEVLRIAGVKKLNESSLSRLWRKYKDSDCGTISACRDERTPSENKQLTDELSKILVGLGYSVTAIDGVFIENYGTPDAKEHSFIVFDYQHKGTLKNDLMKLGEKYGQDSITFSTKDGEYYLIGTTKDRPDVTPSYHQEFKLGKPMFGQDGTFYSLVNGRPFIFTECVNYDYYNYDDNLKKFSGVWAKQGMAKYAKSIMEQLDKDLKDDK